MNDNPIDTLIEEFAERLQKIYDDQTAGDFTFTGVLTHFLQEVKPVKDRL